MPTSPAVDTTSVEADDSRTAPRAVSTVAAAVVGGIALIMIVIVIVQAVIIYRLKR